MLDFKMNNLEKGLNLTLLPVPKDLTFMWNFGSLLMIFMLVQMATGILLASTYMISQETFYLNASSSENMNYILRYCHANGASLIFLFLYAHISRGMYFMSYKKKHTWGIGVTMFILTMATAFMGYVLPVNQMSFWGASVITSLTSEIPFYGPWILNLLWGDFMIDNALYIRFFSIHYFLPFLIMLMIMMHIMLLHKTGSSSSMTLSMSKNKMKFLLYFTLSDMLTAMMFIMWSMYTHLNNFDAWDPDVSAKSSAVITPNHIQPEWYFLYAYAILRAIPSKLGGVIALGLAVMVVYVMPYNLMAKNNSMKFYPLNSTMFWFFIVIVLMLTWIGMSPAEEPYIYISQIFMFMYFTWFFFNQMSMFTWDYYSKT